MGLRTPDFRGGVPQWSAGVMAKGGRGWRRAGGWFGVGRVPEVENRGGLVLGAVLAARPPPFPWGSHPRLGGLAGTKGGIPTLQCRTPHSAEAQGGIYGPSTRITPLPGMLGRTSPCRHWGGVPTRPTEGFGVGWGIGVPPPRVAKS